jgi:hypothetical protein
MIVNRRMRGATGGFLLRPAARRGVQTMTLLDFLRHLPLFGFGIRATTSHIRPDETAERDRLHGR